MVPITGGTPARLAREASVQRRDFITPEGVGHPLVYFHLGKRDSDFEAVEPMGNGSLVWRLGFGKKQIRGSSECYPVFLDDLRISLIRRPMESQ